MTGGWAKGGICGTSQGSKKNLNGLRFERSTEGRRTNLSPTRAASSGANFEEHPKNKFPNDLKSAGRGSEHTDASLRELPNVDPSYTKPRGGKTIKMRTPPRYYGSFMSQNYNLDNRNVRILQLSPFSLVPWVHDIYKLTLESSCPLFGYISRNITSRTQISST